MKFHVGCENQVWHEFAKNKSAKLIYERQKTARFSQNTRFSIRPFIGAREDFLKLAVLLQNDGEYIIKDNFFFSFVVLVRRSPPNIINLLPIYVIL